MTIVWGVEEERFFEDVKEIKRGGVPENEF
jgi:hypothetical protein